MAADDSIEPIELVFVEGPLAGRRVRVPESGSYVLGRTRKGLDLQDNMVSLEHAEINFRSGQGYVITDLGSQSGTYVDGRPLSGTVRLKPGSRVALGESVAYVEEAVNRQSVRPAIGIFAIVVLLGLGVGFVVLGQTSPRDWSEALEQDLRVPGQGPTRRFEFPDGFVRATGLGPRTFAVERIGDVDSDGVEELWLKHMDGTLWVVEVSGAEQYEVLGRLPNGCRAISEGAQVAFDCAGDLWAWNGSEIRPYSSEGAVALANSESLSADKLTRVETPVLLRVGVGPAEGLAGFLASRGVAEPIHYLLCEGAVPGARAQVLTASGRIEALDYGCLDDLHISRTPVDDGYQISAVRAVIFTANGRRALVDDLLTFASGGVESPFLTEPDRALVDLFRAAPVSRQVRRVEFTADPGFFEPIAPESPISGVRTWLPNGERADRPAPHASTVNLTGSGDVELAAGGCSRLRIHTESWQCELSSLCFPNREFIEVRQVGCGRDAVLLSSGYFSGQTRGGDADIEVATQIDTALGRGRVDVARARLTWRARKRP